MKSVVILTIMSMLLYASCDHDVPGNLPPVEPASELPVFTSQENEIEIADSFNNTDPTMVLGAIVGRTNGRVHSFETVLKDNGKTDKRSVSELAFRDFAENSVVADAEWLTFLKGQVNDSIRAEMTVTEVSNVSVGISSIDKGKLDAFALRIAKDRREDYGVVIAYRDFAINASLFKEQSIEGNVNCYGAKVSGKWFGKHESVTADHRIVAVWALLPFVLEKIVASDRVVRDVPLTTLRRQILEDGNIRIRTLDGRRQFKLCSCS